MKTLLTLAASALLTLGLTAQTCEGNACQAKPAPAAQTCPKKAKCAEKADCPAKQKRHHAGKKAADKGAEGPRAQRDGQGPRGPKARPDRRGPEGKGPEAWKKLTPAERAKMLRARAAELEKRAAALEAQAAKADAAE